MNDSPAARLEQEKERARALLADGYAEDHIDQSELDRRLEAVEHATDIAQLHALTLELRPAPPAPLAPTALVPLGDAQQRIPVTLGSIERVGAWAIAPRTEVRVILGDARLDLRQAVLPSGPIELVVKVVLGNLEIIVPPGWRIDNRAGAVLASVEQDEASRPPAADAQVLRITGRVILGSLTVQERLPGEGKTAAWKRRRQDRKALAEASRRALPPPDE